MRHTECTPTHQRRLTEIMLTFTVGVPRLLAIWETQLDSVKQRGNTIELELKI